MTDHLTDEQISILINLADSNVVGINESIAIKQSLRINSRWRWCCENATEDSAGWSIDLVADFPGQSFAAAVDEKLKERST